MLVAALVSCLVVTGTASAAKLKLTRTQIEAENAAAKAQFDAWFQATFTKCGESFFAKARYHDFVYELVGPVVSFGLAQGSLDELNNITTVTVNADFSAQKTRMNARPGSVLWSPGLRGIEGSEVEQVTIKRINEDWTVEPGRWFYNQRIGPIPCEKLPASIAPAELERPAQQPKSAPAGGSDNAEPAESQDDWYLLAALTCEHKDPRDVLALGKLVGVSMNTQDVKQNGKVVATTISAADGSSARFYRGKARCEAALAREGQDLDRYK